MSVAPAADAAWRAYQAMLRSKEAHFGLLESIHSKRNQGQQPLLVETARLSTLLEEHNACVAAFGQQIKELAITDPAAHAALLALLAEVNRDPD